MANLTTTSSKANTKSLGDPCPAYTSLVPLWEKSRAVLNGQSHARAYDNIIDTVNFTNLLLPFSPTMSPQQYSFYRAEGELPGLVAMYAKVILGGLLRKEAQLELEDGVFPDGAEEWIRNNFTDDGNSLHSFLDAAVWEELQTSRAWVLVDHPKIDNPELLTEEQREAIGPYTMVVKAENVINWRKASDPITKKTVLSSLLIRSYEADYSKNEFHPDYVDTVTHYKLDEQGLLVITKYQKQDTTDTLRIINGVIAPIYQADNATQVWNPVDQSTPMMHGERLSFIPAWPLNGQIDPIEPSMQPIIDREIALYNKVSRRNHLLLGAATYTPVVMSNMTDEDFDTIVNSGLGSWIKLHAGDEIKALETPTDSLKDMEVAINNSVEEMARMGIRMLSPEGSSGESGISLEIRNAGQTAQLGLLNTKISSTMRQVIGCMLKWKYDIEFKQSDIHFTLSADFNPTPIGADWMRLITEWYQQGIIPRSTFVAIAKFNDILPSDYDDEDGVAEIESDPLVVNKGQSIDSEITNVDATLNDTQRYQQLKDQTEAANMKVREANGKVIVERNRE
jgi:hypothetical protein